LMHCRPLGFHVGYHGQLQGLRVRHTELGKDGELAAGLVVEAMGLEINGTLRAALTGVYLNDHGLVAVSDGSRTTRPGVHAAGGLVNGGASVARCVAEGMAAADAIHAEIIGRV
jgi:NADPH-dependent glutamate synthase beta subunit-like oxidoreductase